MIHSVRFMKGKSCKGNRHIHFQSLFSMRRYSPAFSFGIALDALHHANRLSVGFYPVAAISLIRPKCSSQYCPILYIRLPSKYRAAKFYPYAQSARTLPHIIQCRRKGDFSPLDSPSTFFLKLRLFSHVVMSSKKTAFFLFRSYFMFGFFQKAIKR